MSAFQELKAWFREKRSKSEQAAESPNCVTILDQYIRDVLSHVRAKEKHAEIRMELNDHLMNRVEEEMGQGVSKSDAEHRAVEQMGTASEMAAQLNQVHRKRWPWLIWAMIGVWLLLSLSSIYVYQNSASYELNIGNDWATRQIFSMIIGMAAFIGINCIDYRKLLRNGHLIFLAVVAVMYYTLISGVVVNSRSFLSLPMHITIDIMSFSPFFLMLGLYLWITNIRKSNSRLPKLQELGVVVASLIPMLIYVWAGRHLILTLYMLGLIALYVYWLRVSWKLISGIVVVLSTAVTVIIINNPIIQERLLNWYHYVTSYTGAQASYYQYERIRETIAEASWFGHGMNSALNVPYLYSDNILVFIVHTFGWSGGLIIAALIVSLFSVMYRSSLQIRHRTGRGIMTFATMYITAYIAICLLSGLGILPQSGVGMPFLSYGLGNTLPWMLILGLFCSIYVRKDILPVETAR